MRIAFIHPEGNFNNNPHLAATITALCRAGYAVDIHAIEKPFSQFPPHPDARVLLYRKYVMRLMRVLSWHRAGRWLAAGLGRLSFGHASADLFIGVDDNGVIVADYLGAQFQRPVALFSYEILFAAEVSSHRKAAEVHACRQLAFAMVQDQERGALLATENRIDPERLVYMPVADWSAAPAEPGWLRHTFGIADERKIALAIGSLDAWTGLDAVLAGLSDWPEDWVMVLHSRYGLTAAEAAEYQRKHPDKLVISREAFAANDDLGKLLGDADIGFGLYYPDYQHEHTGLNLKHIGLASGKLATFLRFGVPVLVNPIGEMADDVSGEDLGVVVGEAADIPAALRDFAGKDPAASNRCQSYFDRKLAVRQSFAGLLERIQASGNR